MMRFVAPWRTRDPGRVRHDYDAVLGTGTRSSMHQIGFVSAESEEVRCCTIQMMRGAESWGDCARSTSNKVQEGWPGGHPSEKLVFILKSSQIHWERSRDCKIASL